MDFAVENAHQAVNFNMGQVCAAGSRTYVHEDIYDEFVKKSTDRAQTRKVGNPFDDVESGPQVRFVKIYYQIKCISDIISVQDSWLYIKCITIYIIH